MPQLRKISRNNTTIGKDADGRPNSVWLHSTCILEVNWTDRVLSVCTGGWPTVTTQTRLNQAFNEWKLPFHASRKGGIFRVHRDGAHREYAAIFGAQREYFEF